MTPARVLTAMVAAAAVMFHGPAAAQTPNSQMQVDRASVSASGAQVTEGGTVAGMGQALSADGRFVVFNSVANGLVPNDTGGRDVFVRDRTNGNTELISVNLSGQAAGGADQQSISADGRFVAFTGTGTNLVPGTIPAYSQIYVRDRKTGVTELVSVGAFGTPAGGDCTNPNLSSDGRYVVFSSLAANLGTNSRGARQIYVRDRLMAATQVVSVGLTGIAGRADSDRPTISGDGRYVAFDSAASDLVAVDANGAGMDVFVRDRVAATTELVHLSASGQQGTGYAWMASIAADGRSVAFESNSPNLTVPGCAGSVCAYVRDRVGRSTEHVSVGSAGDAATGPSGGPRLSRDGRFVAFYSLASNLVPGDTNDQYDVFVRDRTMRVTWRASVGLEGAQANGRSLNPSISENGWVVAFDSQASTLVAGDTNTCTGASPSCPDVFARGPVVQLRAGSLPSPSYLDFVSTRLPPPTISAGDNFTCRSMLNTCWGANTDGQCGSGSLSPSKLINDGIDILTRIGPLDTTQIDCGSASGCAVHRDGFVECWGNNRYGTVGNGTTASPVLVPTQVQGIDAVAVDTGLASRFTCALTTGGTVKCWGYGNSGQLGNGTTTLSTTPVNVTGISGATAIAVGGSHACALLADGRIRCWGDNGFGQLGNGTRTSSSVPVEVVNLRATTIGAGVNHTCAIAGGNVYCWGHNTDGETGQATSPTLVPARVPGLSNARAVTLGFTFTCSLLNDGSVWCWGENGYGQLGNGTTGTAFNPTPRKVVNLPPVVAVSAGYNHTCALPLYSEPKCWGANSLGSLTDGTSNNSAVPVP